MPNPSTTNFDAITWISGRQPSLQRFVGHGSQPLLHFALMWNIFEGELCDSSANPGKLRAVASNLSQRGLMSDPAAVTFLGFVKGRYWRDNAITERFSHLRFQSAAEVAAVTDLLSDAAAADVDVIYALLLVVYRYRNNTFHGLKEIAEVLGNQELFDQSARFLAAAVERAVQ